jgi:hypothetical protein
MPIAVPMYLQHAHPTNASHGVFAPGGYEWWHFDAEDPARGLYLAVEFFDGWPFHPIYRERYERYLRNPTRNAPPVGADYPCVSFAFYEREKCLAALITPFAPRSMAASTGALDVRVGDNFVVRDGNVIRINVHGVSRRGVPVRAYLLLQSAEHSHAKDFEVGRLSAGRHHWIPVAPVLEVEGQVHLGRQGQVIPFTGRGYHDHFYGTGGLATAADGQVRGRVLTEAGFLTFVIPKTREAGERACVVEARRGEFSEVTSEPLTLERAGVGGVPQSIRIGDVSLDEPENLGWGPHGLRIAYNGGNVQAYCDFVDSATAAAEFR